MPGVINQQWVGPTQAELSASYRDRLGNTIQRFQANRQAEEEARRLRQENARKFIFDMAKQNPYGAKGLFMNNSSALALRDSVGQALGTSDPTKIEAFIAGAANSLMGTEAMDELAAELYKRGEIAASNPQVEATNPFAKYDRAWTVIWKPETAGAPAAGTPPAVGGTPPASTPTSGSATASPITIDPMAEGIIKTRPGVRQGNMMTPTTWDVIDPRTGMAIATLDSAEKAVAWFNNALKTTPSLKSAVEQKARRYRGPGVTGPVYPEGVRDNYTVALEPEATAPGNVGVGAGTPQPQTAQAGTFRQFLLANPSYLEPGADFNRDPNAPDSQELISKNPEAYKAYLASKGAGTPPAMQGMPVSTAQAAQPQSPLAAQAKPDVHTSEAYAQMTPEEQVYARYRGKDPALTPQEKRQAAQFEERLVAGARKQLKQSFAATPAAERQWNTDVLKQAAFNLSETATEDPRTHPILAKLYVNQTDLGVRKVEAEILDNLASAKLKGMQADTLVAQLELELIKAAADNAATASADYSRMYEATKADLAPYRDAMGDILKQYAKDPEQAKKNLAVFMKDLEGDPRYQAGMKNWEMLKSLTTPGTTVHAAIQNFTTKGFLGRVKDLGQATAFYALLGGDVGALDSGITGQGSGAAGYTNDALD